MSNLYFDELIFFNHGIWLYYVYSILYEKNHDILISRYEEGIISYDSPLFHLSNEKKVRIIRHLLGKRDITEAYANFYCFYPQIYKGELTPMQVPLLTLGGECANILKKIFDIDGKTLDYSKKYIFFTSVCDIEGGEPIGEFELVKHVANIVSKDDLLVKIHPRDRRTVYQDAGFTVDKNSAIPWEALLVCLDFSDKVMLTVNSGSVMSTNLFTESGARSYYLYCLCDLTGNPIAVKTCDTIKSLLDNPLLADKLKKIKIAENIEEIIG